MKRLLLVSTLLALGACDAGDDATAQLPVADSPVENVAPPEGREWSQIVTKTAAGGYMMGNPDAPVKLVEYGSMTCGACARFDAEGTDPLVSDYVNSGRVSFEFRNFVRDAADITASMIARCGSEDTFFPLTHAMFQQQQQWLYDRSAELQAATQRLQGASPTDQYAGIAEAAGLKTFAAQRGLPASRIDECLSDTGAAEELVSMKSTADADYEITGTPTFLINNKVVTGANQWPGLQPLLAAAVGEEVEDAGAAE